METYSHAFFTWALAKHGVKAGRAAGIAGAVGAALPDLPSIAGTAYYVGADYLHEGWESMHSNETLEAIYFSGPFGGAGSALHSAVLPTSLMVLYWLLKVGGRDRRRIVLWFLLGWFGHAIADFLTHAGDSRPLFWPLSDWEWSSPISYYHPLYYGREFFAVSHGLMALIVFGLFFKRLKRGK